MRATLLSALFSVFALAACQAPSYEDFLPPEDYFDPGDPSSDGYASGSGSQNGNRDGGQGSSTTDSGWTPWTPDGGGVNPGQDGGGVTPGADAGQDSGPQVCAEAQRLCGHEFEYQGNGGEKVVEVHGSFDSWGAGLAMTKGAGNLWSVVVPTAWNTKVLYKFVVDGQWISDPANPDAEKDPYGGSNSVLQPSTCAAWTCKGGPQPGCTAASCSGETPTCNATSGACECSTGSCGTGKACDAVTKKCVPTSTGFDWRDAVLYFVLVDRFLDGDAANNDPLQNVESIANWRGGDWKGVLDKVNSNYFNDLGVNALWLSVPFEQTDRAGAGMGGDTHQYAGYHGYWPKDITKPEPRLGSEADFKALVDAAHAKGIKILIDYAMNHVHEDAPVYQQHKTDGWFHDLYVNGQQCTCGSGVCPWDGPSGTYCWFTSYLPDFNFDNADARAYSVNEGVNWAKRFGIDGFRLDAIKHVEGQWLTDFRAAMKAQVEPANGGQHVYMVGETFDYGNREFLKSFVDPGTKLDGQFDFPLRKQIVENVLMRRGNLSDLAGFVGSNDAFYGPGAVMSTFIGNHDMGRTIHFAQDSVKWDSPYADGKDCNWSNQPGTVGEQSAYERMALGFAILLTGPGVPLVYYGDEIGLAGCGDPDNRRPMDWNVSGYSAGQALLKAKVAKLGQLRAAHSALRRGGRQTLSADGDTWAFKMSDGTDTVYVAINRADSAKNVGGLPSGALTDELNSETVSGPSLSVPARGVRVLKQ
ncbi:MAG TPA: alpha-amylase family glycosyl hydrolase [Myxococcales bacterium]|jgi:glycosidase